MDIVREDLKPILERAHCEDCGDELKKTGKVLYSSPLQYEYMCDNKDCPEYKVIFTDTMCYPSVRFIDNDGNVIV